jgi:hypothetical protein
MKIFGFIDLPERFRILNQAVRKTISIYRQKQQAMEHSIIWTISAGSSLRQFIGG